MDTDPKHVWTRLAKGLAEEEGTDMATVILLATILNMLTDIGERLARVEGSTRRR